MNFWLLSLFVLIGFLSAKFFSGKFEGDRSRYSLRIEIKNYYLHIHHWLYSLLIIIVLLLIKFYNPIIYGLLIGIIVQGLTYRDWYIVIYSKKKYNNIYAKWKPK